jgi:hypothetical protein
MSVLETIKAASAARSRVKICLDAGLAAEHQSLQDAYITESRKALESKTDDKRRAVIRSYAERMDDVSVRMAASEVTFTFERLPWTRRLALQDEHPADEDKPEQKALGFNRATFAPALIRECCVQVADSTSIAAGEDITPEVWAALFDKLNYAEVDRLFGVALSVNDLGAQVPSSALALLNSQDIGGSLKPPEPGTSAQNGSKAGSRPRKRSTRTTTKAVSPA